MNKKTIIALAISGVMILILIIFVVFPLFQSIKENSQEIIGIRTKIDLADKRIEKSQEYIDNYNELALDLEKIDKLFVNLDIPVQKIEFWEKIAEDTELSIEISPFVPRRYETDIWNFVGFKLILTGSFSNFSKFFEKIEAAPYLIEIQDLKIRELTGRDIDYEKMSAKNIKADLSIKVFAK